MSEITKAIEAKQTQTTQLQSDIETLQRAATIQVTGAYMSAGAGAGKAGRQAEGHLGIRCDSLRNVDGHETVP